MDSDKIPIIVNDSLEESMSDIVTCQTNQSFQPDEDIGEFPTNIKTSTVEVHANSGEGMKISRRKKAVVITLFAINLFNYIDRFTVAGIFFNQICMI